MPIINIINFLMVWCLLGALTLVLLLLVEVMTVTVKGRANYVPGAHVKHTPNLIKACCFIIVSWPLWLGFALVAMVKGMTVVEFIFDRIAKRDAAKKAKAATTVQGFKWVFARPGYYTRLQVQVDGSTAITHTIKEQGHQYIGYRAMLFTEECRILTHKGTDGWAYLTGDYEAVKAGCDLDYEWNTLCFPVNEAKRDKAFELLKAAKPFSEVSLAGII